MSHEMMIKTSKAPDNCNWFSLTVSVYKKIAMLLEPQRQLINLERESIEALEIECAKALEAVRAKGEQSLLNATLEETVKTVQLIDQYAAEGLLREKSLEMAYSELDNLNVLLRENLMQYLKDADIADEFTFQMTDIGFDFFDLTDLIRLSDVFCKIMKKMPFETSMLPKYLLPAITEFVSMGDSERSDYFTRINAAVVESNYRANRISSVQEHHNTIDVYKMEQLSDRTEIARINIISVGKNKGTKNFSGYSIGHPYNEKAIFETSSTDHQSAFFQFEYNIFDGDEEYQNFINQFYFSDCKTNEKAQRAQKCFESLVGAGMYSILPVQLRKFFMDANNQMALCDLAKESKLFSDCATTLKRIISEVKSNDVRVPKTGELNGYNEFFKHAWRETKRIRNIYTLVTERDSKYTEGEIKKLKKSLLLLKIVTNTSLSSRIPTTLNPEEYTSLVNCCGEQIAEKRYRFDTKNGKYFRLGGYNRAKKNQVLNYFGYKGAILFSRKEIMRWEEILDTLYKQ